MCWLFRYLRPGSGLRVVASVLPQTCRAAASAPIFPPTWSGLGCSSNRDDRRGNNICSNSFATVEMSPIGLWSLIDRLDLPLPPLSSGARSTCLQIVGYSHKRKIEFNSASNSICHSCVSSFSALFGMWSLPVQDAAFSLRWAVLSSVSVIGVHSG